MWVCVCVCVCVCMCVATYLFETVMECAVCCVESRPVCRVFYLCLFCLGNLSLFVLRAKEIICALWAECRRPAC